MPEEVVNPVANGLETKKVVRRGVSNETRGTTRLKFDTRDAKQNGLFLAHLEDVKVSTFVPGEDKTGMPSFNGLEVPRLTITFASNEEDASKRRYVSMQFNAVESTALTIPGKSEEWKVNLIFDWLKHILNVFVLKGRAMTEKEEEALSLDFVDFDEQGEYVTVPAETVLSSWKNLFTNFEAMMNHGREGDKPVYKTADNKNIAVWIKLIRYFKARTEWKEVNRGDLSFPQFVGEGCIEIYQQNTIPSIKLDITREKIAPMDLTKKQAPNFQAPVPAGGVDIMGASPMGTEMGGTFGGPVPVQDDLPF